MRAYIEISNICNLKCSFCPEVERNNQVMSPESFAQIAKQLSGKVDEICLHLMGEPLNHPDLSAIMSIAEQYGLPINLTTNGLLLTGKKRELVLSRVVRQVNISIQSFEANFPERDVTPYMDRVMSFIKEAAQSRPDLYINLRLWDLNEPHEAPRTNQVIRKRLEAEFEIDFSNLKVDVRRKKSILLSPHVYLNLDSRFTWPHKNLPVRSNIGFCHGLATHFGIHADGTVVPCCLDKEANINLGNALEDEGIDTALQSERAIVMKEGFNRGELKEDLCQKCPFIARFDRKAKRLRHAHPSI